MNTHTCHMVLILMLKYLLHQAFSRNAYKRENEKAASISLREEAECSNPELTFTSEKWDLIVLGRN